MAGKGRGIESGIAAAKLANQTNPFLIIPTTLGVFEGTELFAKMQSGKFEEAGEKENLQEQKAFLAHIELSQTYYWSAHALNSTPVVGFLNTQEKKKMIEKLDQNIQAVNDDLFKQKFKRTSL